MKIVSFGLWIGEKSYTESKKKVIQNQKKWSIEYGILAKEDMV